MKKEGVCGVVLIWFLSSVASLEIDTSDGGYTNLLVSINGNVPYKESIIQDIKALFRLSSKFLHQVTNGRVYYKQVTIEMPSTWPARQNVRNVSASSFERSDVRIDAPGEPYGDRPFTQQLRPCGQPGDFIQLTPRFLSRLRNSTTVEPLNVAYMFVHQWAHFRYGVFDEHGCNGDSEYPLTYCHNGKVKLNACSEKIAFTARTLSQGKCSVDSACRLSRDCVVTLHQPSNSGPIESSIMFMPRIDSVSQFCDDASGARQHNPFAPNKQNRLCQQRSAWEVIRQNADFQKLPRPDMSKRIETSFIEIQEIKTLAQCVVLVLDVSASMSNYERLESLKEAVTRYINGVENETRRLAILTFSEKARVVHPLAPVNAKTKPGFIRAVKELQTLGATCIGCGLRRAIKQLEDKAETTEGAIIALVSDGEENRHPDIESVMPLIIKAKVVVNTLAVGETAEEKLEQLASKTRGKAYAIKDAKGNAALEMEAAFVRGTTPSLERTSRDETLVDTAKPLDKLLEQPFQVDSSVGNETVVYIKGNGRQKANIKASLIDPSGQRCQTCQESSTEAGIAIFMPSPAEAGTWVLHLSSSDNEEVSIQVKSKARKEGEESIQVACTMANMLVDQPDAAVVYVKVSKGKKVVLGASVLAEVYGPQEQQEWTVQLHDDGREPDNHAGDGVYSGHFTKFTGKGRYTVAAHVSYKNGTHLAYPTDSSACVLGILSHTTTDDRAGSSFASEHAMDEFILKNTTLATSYSATGIEAVDPFERVAPGGSFQVTRPILETQVAPGNIRDLAVTDMRPGENGSLSVDLTFTWPGAHLTFGKASSVEIRAGVDYVKLKSHFDSQTQIAELSTNDQSTHLQSCFTKHVAVVTLPTTLASPQPDGASAWNVYVAARATNTDRLKSNASNVVSVSYKTPPLSSTLATTTMATTTTTTTRTTTRSTEAATTTERATTKALITTPRSSTTQASTSSATSTSTLTSTLSTTTLPPTTIPSEKTEDTATETPTVFNFTSNVEALPAASVGTTRIDVFLALSKWIPIGGAIAAGVAAMMAALIMNVKQELRQNNQRSLRRVQHVQTSAT